jgi:predicted PhzF superfamily epimerase YddE/YHI9
MMNSARIATIRVWHVWNLLPSTSSPVKFSAATRWRYFFAAEQLRDQQMQQIARMFAPLQGMAEDPATGSAAGALAGLRA